MRTNLDLIVAIEKADWDQVTELSNQLQVDESEVCTAYMEAVKWAQEIYAL